MNISKEGLKPEDVRLVSFHYRSQSLNIDWHCEFAVLASFDDFIRILVDFFHYFLIREIQTCNKNIIFQPIIFFPVKFFLPFPVRRLAVSLCLEDLFFHMSFGELSTPVHVQLLLREDNSSLYHSDMKKLKMDFGVGLFHTVSTFILIRGVIF